VSHQRLLQSIIFFASFSGTAVLNVGDYGMAPDVVLLSFLLLVSLLSGRLLVPARLSRDHLIVGFLILVFTSTVAFSTLFNGAIHGVVSLQVTQTAYLLFGICLTMVLSIEFTTLEQLEAGISALRAGATFISLWGLFQAACYYTGIEYPAFLFNNSKSHFADMYDQRAAEGVVRIASVATEPSFMATSLMIFGAFGATVIALDPLRRTANWIVPVILTLLTVALSTSSTGYFGLAVLCLLLARRRPGFALAVFGSLAVVGAVCLLAVPSARDAVYNMTLGKFTAGSYLERSTTIAPAMELFARQPWFGFGWGADFSYSIVTMMLANAGLVGSIAFVCAILATLVASRIARQTFGPGASDLAAYAEAAENALLVYIAECAVSGFKYVVADFWCLWAFAIAIPSCMSCLLEGIRPVALRFSPWRPRSASGDA
jgi:O-Antigen ligase